MLLYGYINKEKETIILKINNEEVIDRYAEAFNNSLELCKVFGLLSFLFGGLILACSLFLPTFVCYKQCIYREDQFLLNKNKDSIKLSNNRLNFSTPTTNTKVDFAHIQPQSLKKTSKFK